MPRKKRNNKKRKGKKNKTAAKEVSVEELIKQLEANVNDHRLWAPDSAALKNYGDVVWPLMGRIAKQQQALDAVPNSDPKVLEDLRRWYCSHLPQSESEAFQSTVQLRHAGASEGNGLYANKDCNKGDLLLRVPVPLIMSTLSAARCAVVGRMLAMHSFIAAIPSVALALHVLWERLQGERSFFAPYIRSLPQTFSVPIFYPPAALALLKGSPTLASALGHLRRLLKYFCLIRRMAVLSPASAAPGFSADTFTLSGFMWAVAIVMTRQNSTALTRGAAGRDMLSLVPVFDLANHEDGEFSTDFRTDAEAGGEGKGGLVCFAKRDFKGGEQLRIFYGKRPASAIFLYSGFVPTASAAPLTAGGGGDSGSGGGGGSGAAGGSGGDGGGAGDGGSGDGGAAAVTKAPEPAPAPATVTEPAPATTSASTSASASAPASASATTASSSAAATSTATASASASSTAPASASASASSTAPASASASASGTASASASGTAPPPPPVFGTAFDKRRMQVALLSKDPLLKVKNLILTKNMGFEKDPEGGDKPGKLPTFTFDLSPPTSPKVCSPPLLSFLRVREANKADVRLMLTGSVGPDSPPLNPDNERRALQQMRRVVERLREAYRHTPTHRDTEFREGVPVENVLALRMVASEQSLLSKVDAWCARRLLDLTPDTTDC